MESKNIFEGSMCLGQFNRLIYMETVEEAVNAITEIRNYDKDLIADAIIGRDNLNNVTIRVYNFKSKSSTPEFEFFKADTDKTDKYYFQYASLITDDKNIDEKLKTDAVVIFDATDEDSKFKIIPISELQPDDKVEEPEADKFEKNLFNSIFNSVQRILTDEHTVKSFESIRNSIIKIAYPDEKDPKFIEHKQSIIDSSQMMTKGILDMISSSITISAYEAIGFYDTIYKEMTAINNSQISTILNDHMSRIEVLSMKFGDLEKKLIESNIKEKIE